MTGLQRGGILILGLLLPLPAARAQSSLDLLQKDLDQLKEEHQEVASKNFDYFLTALAGAATSPDSAEKLYFQAGGAAPEPAKVRTQYEHETPTEESAREALDQATMASFDGALQLHCGMMRLAALYVTQPKLAGLDDAWIAWLKSASQSYPQIAAAITDPRVTAAPAPDAEADNSDGHHGHKKPEPPPDAKIDASSGIRNLAMRDSPISNYLGFHAWGDKEQGQWRIADLPRLYRDDILEPSRKSPTAATQAAWDVYIAMMNADQPDADRWADVDYPALQFEKACDDFKSEPSTDKVEALIAFIKAHPTHPQIDDWINRVHNLIEGYRAQGQASAAPASSSALPPIEPDPVTPTPATNAVPPAH
jgi:hypothetical protein